MNYKYKIYKTDSNFNNIFYQYELYYNSKYNRILYNYNNDYVKSFRKYFKKINNEILNNDIKKNINIFFIIESIIKKNNINIPVNKQYTIRINNNNKIHYYYICKEIFI